MVVGVGGDVGRSHHIAGIEDVEALVFHGTEIEVVGGHDHEAVEVELKPPAFFVPGDRLLEAFERVLGVGIVLFFRPHLQQHFAAALSADFCFARNELTGYQSKEIAGFLEGVFPAHPMAVVGFFSFGDQVSVGKQHWVERLVGVDRDGKAAHHVGAVRPVGDVSEALGFALTHERTAAHVDT